MKKPRQIKSKNINAQACDAGFYGGENVKKFIYVAFETYDKKDIAKLIKWLKQAEKWIEREK